VQAVVRIILSYHRGCVLTCNRVVPPIPRGTGGPLIVGLVMPLPKVLPQAQVQKPAPRVALPEDQASSSSSTGGQRVVANRYRLGSKLGCGAFGTAFLVIDRKSSDDR
jgi:hypothetical protein